ncbi:Domain of unknown function DUF4341 [Ostreococcus tauri]|uniref:Sulphur transport domain-containing protein n=1 Tax=Ostreococcus tauri TaxID=70448 RepID=A0A090M641_OSTTA|nr:Domain of unknown function DUF4341 [Ostreococcus tauri]OUS47771.1 hypothetical protein BE221DRAFT_190077 [Ostreococcus tauri]CEF98142.1 Domain of unknown function DUF4341 [Ostreococcus tauri]|eukprot:XP_022839104.1 Domain of unknown function DUF4341 [Ostreococcus tauri]
MSTELSFTPHHALGGGILLGVAVIGKLALTGRVLGVSGAFKGLVKGAREPWRLAFVGGLVAAGACARTLGALDENVSATTPSAARAAIAGALVGVGTAMGRGCTSGHGIVGNSRLSPRSFAYTLVFMATGAACATVFQTNAALDVDSKHHVLGRGTIGAERDDVELWVRLGAAAVCAFAAAAVYIKRAIAVSPKDGKGEAEVSAKKKHAIDVVVDGAAGLVFGLGLAVSGMMSPAKVSAFLSVLEPSWDPSLMFVMGGAMAVTMAGIRFAKAHTGLHKPTCSYNNFDFATNKNIDRPLLIGGVLFGAGWGLGGICPGPAIVSSVANPSAELGVWIASFIAGMWAHENFM